MSPRRNSLRQDTLAHPKDAIKRVYRKCAPDVLHLLEKSGRNQMATLQGGDLF
eukprot:TRINITY_DN2251_c1_g1_i1.p3 TRINITY_DN2251_c1_g1~~TRINITY_DN2251_c1_g1_i1.p3  ORF type:complete len:53 (-),score=10.39 TRINITY_DN2251_c1_g1_i1:222-380(-)